MKNAAGHHPGPVMPSTTDRAPKNTFDVMLIRFYSFQSFKRLGSKNIKLNRLYWTNVSSPAAKSSYLFKMTKAATGFLALQVSKLSTFSTNAAVPNTFLFLNRALYSAILTQTACLGFFHLHSFLTPVSQPGFEPTSVELHQTGSFRTLYRLSNTAATGCTKYLVLAATELSIQSINFFCSRTLLLHYSATRWRD